MFKIFTEFVSFYSPEPCSEVCCFRLNLNISKLVYSRHVYHTAHPFSKTAWVLLTCYNGRLPLGLTCRVMPFSKMPVLNWIRWQFFFKPPYFDTSSKIFGIAMIMWNKQLSLFSMYSVQELHGLWSAFIVSQETIQLLNYFTEFPRAICVLGSGENFEPALI